MNSSFLYHAWGLYSLECTKEEYKGNTIILHVQRLHGNHADEWECHISPDWLLVWEQHDDELILLFTNTGSHSDVFGKNKK